MAKRLLICTDLDRTLIPNGPQPESPAARRLIGSLVARPEVTLAYVSGRHRALIEQAIADYALPRPDFVIGDVGTTQYRVSRTGEWRRETRWEQQIAADWAGRQHADVAALLHDVPSLRLQENEKQNALKLSYYVPLDADKAALTRKIGRCFRDAGVDARQIWSVDEPAAIGLLDILPASASKLHAIEALMRMHGFDLDQTVFCGDSGNDIEVLASPIHAVLVANADRDVRDDAFRRARQDGNADSLYAARGGYLGLNGNYGGGMLEGIAHYHAFIADWLLDASDERAR